MRALIRRIKTSRMRGLNPFYSPSLDVQVNFIEPLGRGMAEGIRQGIEEGGKSKGNYSRIMEARRMGLFPTIEEVHERLMRQIEELKGEEEESGRKE